MTLYKFDEQTRTYIKVVFNYSESCHNVYRTFNVFANGKKSNRKALDKFVKSEYPAVITSNTYFWSPSSSASGRRSNEKRIDKTVEQFFNAEGFAEKDYFELNNDYLFEKEKFGIDELGYYLLYRKEKYHFGFINIKKIKKEQINDAREAIKKRRMQNIINAKRVKEFEELKSKVFVTFDDSIEAGNCKSATQSFIDNLSLSKKGFHLRALRADELLKVRNDSFALRAVYKAIDRYLKNKILVA